MFSTSVYSLERGGVVRGKLLRDRASIRVGVGLSCLFVALIQSVCTFLAALDGVRLLIGVGAALASAGAVSSMDAFHNSWVHLPMILIALSGAVLNLVVLWQVRRLRARPAAQWRITPPSARKIRMERVQFALSVATLLLIVAEESLHMLWMHRF